MSTSLLRVQKYKITEHHIYNKLADITKDKKNKEVLYKIASKEKEHYKFFKNKTNRDVTPNRFRVWGYVILAKIFGLNFGLSLMESKEQKAKKIYGELKDNLKLDKMLKEEKRHEQQLSEMIDKTKLEYTSSVVLGLNDALVELTGALAGLTLALKNTRLIAIVGLITGIAASLSMAGSEYLSTKEEKKGIKEPFKAGTITGLSYLMAVILLILPFFFFTSPLLSLAITITVAIIIITSFSLYTSTLNRDISFGSKFLEMTVISLGVATINFALGYLIRSYFGVDV